jgi:thioredoxin reductase
MHARTPTKFSTIMEYVFVGAGPANLCAILKILESGVPSHQIVWIDQGGFKVGDFGSILSVGSSVPGNTSVESYRKVNHYIYKTLGKYPPIGKFELDSLQANYVCSLKIAAEPMQYITNELRAIVDAKEGSVTHIYEVNEGLQLTVKLVNGQTESLVTKRCILATGAKPKTVVLPAADDHIVMIDSNIVFIQTELAEYLRKNPQITTVVVIGSSHSAALATMHLLTAGLTVKQFMNKEYKFATSSVSSGGVEYTKFDNTGLKGEVAAFTRKLLAEDAYKNKYSRYIGSNQQEANKLMAEHLKGCTHAVAAIGYEASSTLLINNKLLSTFTHDKKTTEFKEVKGLFGIGIAFPQEITAISGEVESSVGYLKFWSTVNDAVVLEAWNNNIVGRHQSKL